MISKSEADKHREVADALDALALRMRSVAAMMEDCKDATIVGHGNQLSGASEHARDWAKCIRILKQPEDYRA